MWLSYSKKHCSLTFSSPTFAKNNLGLRFFNPSIWQKVGILFTYEQIFYYIFFENPRNCRSWWAELRFKASRDTWKSLKRLKYCQKTLKTKKRLIIEVIEFVFTVLSCVFLFCAGLWFMLQPGSALRLSPLFHISPWLRPCKKDRTKNKIDNIDDFRTFTWLILRGCRQV